MLRGDPTPRSGKRNPDVGRQLVSDELRSDDCATEAIVAAKGAESGDYAPEVAAMAKRPMYGDLFGGS
jgi:hypothetical protein